MNFTFDANIFIYSTGDATSLHAGQAQALLARASKLSTPPHMMQQTAVECLNAMRRRLKFTLTKSLSILDGWRSLFDTLPAPQGSLSLTCDLLMRHKLSVWDAHLLAACDALGIATHFSADMSDGERYGNVRVIDPFKPENAAAIDALLSE